MSQRLQLSSVTVNCPDAAALAEFYAQITDGQVTFSHPSWATMKCAGGRVDFQTVDDYAPARWPEQTALIHLDFLVDDLEDAAQRVVTAGATRLSVQPNIEQCLVFADPVGNPFCLTLLDEVG
jgi:catechol-2,3-dioxygenase